MSNRRNNSNKPQKFGRRLRPPREPRPNIPAEETNPFFLRARKEAFDEAIKTLVVPAGKGFDWLFNEAKKVARWVSVPKKPWKGSLRMQRVRKESQHG